MRRDVKIPHRK